MVSNLYENIVILLIKKKRIGNWFKVCGMYFLSIICTKFDDKPPNSRWNVSPLHKVPISQIIQHCYSLSYVANHDWN